jgi:hypothetical protein
MENVGSHDHKRKLTDCSELKATKYLRETYYVILDYYYFFRIFSIIPVCDGEISQTN